MKYNILNTSILCLTISSLTHPLQAFATNTSTNTSKIQHSNLDNHTYATYRTTEKPPIETTNIKTTDDIYKTAIFFLKNNEIAKEESTPSKKEFINLINENKDIKQSKAWQKIKNISKDNYSTPSKSITPLGKFIFSYATNSQSNEKFLVVLCEDESCFSILEASDNNIQTQGDLLASAFATAWDIKRRAKDAAKTETTEEDIISYAIYTLENLLSKPDAQQKHNNEKKLGNNSLTYAYSTPKEELEPYFSFTFCIDEFCTATPHSQSKPILTHPNGVNVCIEDTEVTMEFSHNHLTNFSCKLSQERWKIIHEILSTELGEAQNEKKPTGNMIVELTTWYDSDFKITLSRFSGANIYGNPINDFSISVAPQ